MDINSTTTTNKNKLHTQHSNLTKGEIDSLNKFKNRDDTIVTKADKGGAVHMNIDDDI